MSISIEAAKKYINIIQHTFSIGPHRIFKNKKDSKQMNELAKIINCEIKKINDKTYFAPSPWHAASWLLDLSSITGQMCEKDIITGFESPYLASLGSPIFRGQREPSWELIPTLLRNNDKLEDNSYILKLFLDSNYDLFKYYENKLNNPYVHMAAAQHYGLPTPLLDFTLDPRIAVFFACQGAKSKKVVVYFIPFNDLIELGGAIILPPLWVKRLYYQRGLFLNFLDLPNNINLKQFFFKILFPPNDEYLNLFNYNTELLPIDEWYQKAIEFVKSFAKKSQKKFNNKSFKEKIYHDFSNVLTQELYKYCGKPQYLYDLLLPESIKILHTQAIDLLDWVAVKLVNSKFTYDLTAMSSIYKYNEAWFKDLNNTYKYLNKRYAGLCNIRNDRLLAFLEAINYCIEHKENDR